MNKQEAIEIIEQSKIKITNRERVIFKACEIIGESVQVDYVPLEVVVNTINQIHEPQKVVVPKHVAEWIEELKKSCSNLAWVWEVYPNEPKIKNWLESNTEKFMRAWLDGYEVEQEKLYEVTVPGTSNYKNQRQHLVKQGKHWFFCGNDVNRFKYRFTKGQIEAAGFGWVFDCDGVKVVEVER